MNVSTTSVANAAPAPIPTIELCPYPSAPSPTACADHPGAPDTSAHRTTAPTICATQY